MSKNSMQRELPSQYQGAELAVRLMLWVPFAPAEFQNAASFVGLGFKVAILSWHSLSLVITDGMWQFCGEILTSPAVLFLLLQLLLLLNAELVACPGSCLKDAIIPLWIAYSIARQGMGDHVDRGVFFVCSVFVVMLVCLFSHFLNETGDGGRGELPTPQISSWKYSIAQRRNSPLGQDHVFCQPGVNLGQL